MRSIASLAAVVMLGSTIATSAGASEMRASESIRPAVGVIVATLGVVGFGTAVVLGRERSKSEGGAAHCSVDVCTSTATLLVQDARSQSDLAFRLMAASAVALVGGVALYLTTTKQSRAEIVFAGGGLTFRTTF